MDFYSLTRRELQALCKKNKIPANTTNIAMADALKALDIVEGMEEFLNSVESPEKASPCVPRTGGRTSTRRKPIKEEPESVQISTRTRRGTRKAIIGGEVENAKVDVAETPAMQSSQKRAPLTSAVRKMEIPGNQKEDVSAWKMYSTRRSTRLLEKKMMELNLDDKEGIEPIDFGSSGQEMPNHDFGKALEDKGLNQQTDDLEALPAKTSDELSENARELEQVSEVLDETDIVLVLNAADRLKLNKDKDGDDEVNDENTDDDDSDSETKSGAGESLDKSLHLKYEVPGEDGCDDSGLGTFLSDTENTSDCLVSEKGEEGFNAEKNLDLEDSVAVAAAEDQKQDIELQKQDSVVFDINSVKNQNGLGPELNDIRELSFGVDTKEPSNEELPCDDAKTDLEVYDNKVHDLESTLIGEDELKEGMVLSDAAEVEFDQLVVEASKEDGSNSDTDSDRSATKEPSNEKLPCDDAKTDLEAYENEVQDLESTLIGEDKLKESMVLSDDADVEFDQLVVDACNEDGLDSDTDSDRSATTESAVSMISEKEGMVLSDDAEGEFDQLVVEACKEDGSDSDTDSDRSAVSMISENAMVDQLTDQDITNFGNLMASANPSTLSLPSDKTRSPMILSAEAPVEIPPFSILAADPLPGSSSLLQPGSNSEHIIRPASLTPIKKSASKTPTTGRKINILLDDNKENIDNSGKRLDLTKEKGKKDKKKDAAIHNDTSLRQLKKIFKEKLQVSNNTNIKEEKNIDKVGRARPALQTLSENRSAASELESEI